MCEAVKAGATNHVRGGLRFGNCRQHRLSSGMKDPIGRTAGNQASRNGLIGEFPLLLQEKPYHFDFVVGVFTAKQFCGRRQGGAARLF